jgi:hypothetical protein
LHGICALPHCQEAVVDGAAVVKEAAVGEHRAERRYCRESTRFV